MATVQSTTNTHHFSVVNISTRLITTLIYLYITRVILVPVHGTFGLKLVILSNNITPVIEYLPKNAYFVVVSE